ncbi:MAG TPA: hypothetical protein VKX28_02025 [Xanthobacteraceae bacterium]|nr:hypothetical protein [Xanthobacteraceae bacterium]
MLVCVTLISGALFGMAAQSGLLHLGLDFGSVRDDLIVGQIAAHGAHSRPALAWWAWCLVPLAAFFVGPLSVAVTRWLITNWWLLRTARFITTAMVVLMLAAIGELPPAATTLDVRSGVAASMLVAIGSALLAWLGARVVCASGCKRAWSPGAAASERRRPAGPPPDHIRCHLSPPIPMPAPWRGGGSVDAGTPFLRVRQRHSLVARIPSARLALVAGFALLVFAGVAAVSGLTVLVEQATPGALRQLAALGGLPVEAPASAAQVGLAATAPVVIAAAPAGMVIDGVLVPESELTFAKGYLKRRAAIAAAITAAQRESARIVAAAEKAEDKRPKHVAALRPVQYGHTRRHVAYIRHAERHGRVRRRYAGERHPPYRAHEPRRLRGHDHYARLEPHYGRF